MTTALTAQLADIARQNPDAGRLQSAKALKTRESYLYTGRQAAHQSLDDVHAIGLQGLDELSEVDASFERFRGPLFGEGAKRLDRTLLPKNEVEGLDRQIEAFLVAVGPHVLVKASALALEWLIRRFRINEFNVEAVVAAFLPYYTTPQFASMLHILHLKSHQNLSWLLPVQATRAPLPKEHLVDSLAKYSEALRYFADILPDVLRTDPHRVHRALVGLHLTTLLGVFDQLASRKRTKAAEPPFSATVLSIIIPSLRAGVQAKSNPEVQLASYVLVSALVQRARPSREVIEGLVKLVAGSRHKVPAEGNGRIVEGTSWTDCDEALVRTLVVLYQSFAASSDSVYALPTLTATSTTRIAKLGNIAPMLEHISKRFDVTAFSAVFFRGLAEGAAQDSSLQGQVLLQISHLPFEEKLLVHLMRALLDVGSSLAERAAPVQRPLSFLAQRYPQHLETLASGLISADPSRKADIEATVRLVVLGEGVSDGETAASDAIALLSGSATVRESALERTLQAAPAALVSEDDDAIASLRGTLRTALADPSPSVAKLLLRFGGDVVRALPADDFLVSIRLSLASEDLPRAILKAHLDLLCNHFLLEHPARAVQVAEEFVAWRLLVTKGGAKAAAAVWDVFSATSEKTWNKTILEGVARLASTVKTDAPEAAIQTDDRLVQRVSENLARTPEAVVRLMEFAAADGAPSPLKLFVLSTLRALPTHGKGLPQENLIAICHRLLGPGHLDIGADRARWATLSGAATEGKATEAAIYSKTTSPKTFARLAAATVKELISRLRQPTDAAWLWLGGPLAPQEGYRSLVRELFSLAHATPNFGKSDTTTLAAVARTTLFDQLLSEDMLAFLASVWTSRVGWQDSLRCAALLDAATWIRQKPPQDYQLVLPSLLIALADQNRSVREAALVLVRAVGEAYSSAAGDAGRGVYGLDCFYGPTSSGHLEYLSASDAAELVATIELAKEEILLDNAFLKIVLEDRLAARDTRAGKKTKSGLKHSVVCFLLASLGAWRGLAPRIDILRCITEVRDPSKTLQATRLVKGLLLNEPEPSADQKDLVCYTTLLIDALASTPRKLAEGKDNENWSLLVEIVESSDSSASKVALRDAALHNLSHGLLGAIPLDRRLEALQAWIRLAASSRIDAAAYAAALRATRLDSTTLAVLLLRIAETLPAKPVRGHKRARTSTGSAHISATATDPAHLVELAILLENVDFEKVDASSDLIGALIDTLVVLNDAHSHTQTDIHFSAQLLVSALVTAATRAKGPLEADKLRLGPVIDYMRISPNPYVAQQAMLFIAEVAPRAPEQALQSVMPIFTFVGANVLHRDDSASARTVEKMIQALVPPLVDQAKSEGGDRVQAVHRLRGLILSFVGASSHIPRHRRLRLFTRLVEVLGAYDFLGAVVAFLVASEHDESGDAADLALRLWESFPSQLGIAALAHLASEVEVLSGPLDGQAHSILLDDSADDLESVNPLARAQALLDFIKMALGSRTLTSKLDSARASGERDSDAVLSYFLRMIAELSGSSADEERASSIRDISRLAAQRLSLSLLSDALGRMLESDSDLLSLDALWILRSRLPTVKPDRRPELEACIKAAIRVCERHLDAQGTPKPSLVTVIEALEAMVEAPSAGELNALAAVFPRLLRLATSAEATPTLAAASLSTAERLAGHLGPRLIARFAFAVQSCGQLITGSAEQSSSFVVSRAFALLAAVTQSASAFLTPHLRSLVSVLARSAAEESASKSAAANAARSDFTTALVKSAKLGELASAIADVWPQVEAMECMTSLLDLLQRAVKHSKPQEASTSAKSVFGFLLAAFDVRLRLESLHLSIEGALSIEKAAIDVFLALVFKLSEQTLKPLVLRLIDWAVISPEAGQAAANSRRIVLYKLFARLLTQLKSIGLPFFVYVLEHATATLEGRLQGGTKNLELWDNVITVLQKSLEVDSVGFWSSQRLGKVISPVTAQLALAPKLGDARIRTALIPLIAVLSPKVSQHDALLKILNASVLRHVRSDELRVKRSAIEALDAMWRELGAALVPLVPETVGTGLAEALEEPEGGVEAAARKLLTRIEGELGGESIDSYLA